MTDKLKKIDKFPYRSIVNSTQFKHVERDLLKALLDENKVYSLNEAKKILDKEIKREVK